MNTFRTFLSFLILSVVLQGLAQNSKATLTVVESEIRATLGYDSFIITAPVRNTLSTPISGKLNIDLLGPEDDVLATAAAERVLKPGAGQLKVDLRTKPLKRQMQFPWYRVRYRLSADSRPVDSGIVSLGAITPDLFDLTVAYSETAEKGKPYLLHVHAFNPVVHRPVGGVAIAGSYDNGAAGNGTGSVTKVSAITSATGDADLTFSLPASSSPGEGQEIKLQAKKGPVSYDRDIEFSIDSRVETRLQTDKPLYQPKQTMHLRSLSFDSRHHAIDGETITFSVQDPESNVAFKGEAKTNKYGIASIDWVIPESARLGDYDVRAEREEGGPERSGHTTVRISQYDLPSFTLHATGDRSYYLPGDNALVEITARYLFGEPIPNATVRVMPAPEGNWDWRNQKWEAKEGEEIRGTLDAEGRVRLAVNLQKAHEEFKQTGYLRFRDIDYVALVTDPSTGKSERSRFTLRLSHEDIHVYVISASMLDKATANFYLATYYPDGSPAPAQVEISQLESDEKDPSKDPKEQVLRTIKTNRYGVAKVQDLHLRQNGKDSNNVVLLLTARDSKGKMGRKTEDLWAYKPIVSVSTNKTLYREDESIEVTLRCRDCDGNFHVEIQQDGVVVASQRAHLKHGNAFLVFPHQRHFQGELTVEAYPTDVSDDWSAGTLPGSRTILFPHDSELKLNVSLDHASYLPAGEMNAAIRVRASDGASQQGVLGVVLVDEAVEERAREDGLTMGEHWWDLWKEGASAGGVTRHDLDQIDLSQPVSADLDLVAEIILDSEGRMYLPSISGGDYVDQTSQVFRKVLEKELSPLYTALSCSDIPNCTFPADTAAVQAILDRHNANLAQMRDPWGTPFRIQIDFQDARRVVTVTSAGPDKRFDTDDDFTVKQFSWNYFDAVGKAMDGAVKEAHARSGAFVRDYATLRSEMLRHGFDLDTLTDPWGNRYQFDFSVNGPRLLITVKTHGAGGRHADKAEAYVLWTSAVNYFDEIQKKIDQALALYMHDTGEFPRDEATLRNALARSSISFDNLRDPWGSPYYVTFRRLPEYGTTVIVKPNTTGAAQVEEQPVTRIVDWLWINSAGPDLASNTSDDFTEASFSRVSSVESADLKVQSGAKIVLADLTGAINGVVVDPVGAVIANAQVTATREGDTQKYTAASDDSGTYLIRNLPAGLYSVEIYARGFQASVVQRVPVHSSSLTEVNAVLHVGTTTETVEVTAAAPSIETTAASLSVKSKVSLPEAQIRIPTSTPHLRQYFPETLYWQPSLMTDRSGNAALKVKLADTITTWKLVAFASTEDGRVGIAEKDVRAFQPFFAEHEPPKVLTLGDEITLPVIVRNYLAKPQTVDVSMKPANWFSITGPEQQRLVVRQNDAGRAQFQIHASESIEEGKQQVSAISGDAGDAVEKPVTVHPYGERRVAVSNQVAGDSAMELDVPTDAIASSLHAQLKIYPNLIAHVIESVEAGLARPYGCGEQTISSTYPSLMVVKYYQAQGTEPPIAARAHRYLGEGYERLLRYQEPEGGFSYWGHGDPNVALTAYALRFLTEAGRVIDVDPARISAALRWLVRQQEVKGSWQSDDKLTAYVLWTLVDLEHPQPAGSNETKMLDASMATGLSYLTARTAATSDPYVMALSVLALVHAGHRDAAAPLVDRLSREAHVKEGKVYWELSGSTLFHSWGLPGQVEVTALVLRALHAFFPQDDQGPVHELINQGLLFLARTQDHYGVWYSGQTTWNVLNVMLELTKKSLGDDRAVEAKIVINGRLAKPVEIPQEKQATGPMYLDVTNYIAAGKNKIEILVAKPIALAGAQVSAAYYVPWSSAAREAWKPEGSQALRLAVHFDKTQATPGEPIDCNVEVGRIGRYGWGMLLAEIGVPPGADVDRESLEKAAAASGWQLDHYEVLPDRIVVYVWPRAGGTKFHFIFKPRFEMHAYSAPSTLYDYYNPEAYVVVAPEMFQIRASQPAAIAQKATGR